MRSSDLWGAGMSREAVFDPAGPEMARQSCDRFLGEGLAGFMFDNQGVLYEPVSKHSSRRVPSSSWTAGGYCAESLDPSFLHHCANPSDLLRRRRPRKVRRRERSVPRIPSQGPKTGSSPIFLSVSCASLRFLEVPLEGRGEQVVLAIHSFLHIVVVHHLEPVSR